MGKEEDRTTGTAVTSSHAQAVPGRLAIAEHLASASEQAD
jgi:hypothetical protein